MEEKTATATATPTSTKWVYDFSEGSREMRVLLGGKGANIAEMTRILGADRVPAGFTITTEACVAYMEQGHEPEGLDQQVAEATQRLQELTGKVLGDPHDPLLVSVRSGARDSMPGMMDTVLNLGLNDVSVEGLIERTGNPRFAWDSYRRFIQMFGNVVRGIPGDRFEEAIADLKRERGVQMDTELTADDLKELAGTFEQLFRDATGEDFPQEPAEQLRQSIRAVFGSWMGDRAVSYRRIENIPDDWGTAVNVQQMVFGNKGDSSATGVAFSRDEMTGEPEPSGDFLVNAQGEDVVSGVRNTLHLEELAEIMPEAHGQLLDTLRQLERHYGDIQDCEFTIEEGRLYMLQTRNAKRPAQAAIRFACDAVDEGLLTKQQALMTLDAGKLDALLHPSFDPSVKYEVLATGVSASPGAAKGEVVFTAGDAVDAVSTGRDVILVRPFTEADDVAGFFAARGILTSEGGKASHAALVARGMGRPAVCGASSLSIDLRERVIRIGDTVVREGDRIAIDGSTGVVTLDDVPLVEAEVDENFHRVLDWCDEFRRLGVRANADTPEDAKRAREFGAQGIGLCRTEHMFMAEDRQPKMRRMIMAEDEREGDEALAQLLPLQKADFEGLFHEMRGLPVTIRLLDPPLHEFMPQVGELQAEVGRARLEASWDLPELEQTLKRVEELSETNPMLGLRGVRLGLVRPAIYEMQVEAIMLAIKAVRERTGEAPLAEIMIPLVDYSEELRAARAIVERIAAKHELEDGKDFIVGTMLELPRACFAADSIANHASFFSFGTNDLTQTALGFSRDDAEGHFLADYLEKGIVKRSPFETIDRHGVGELVQIGCERGRKTHDKIKLGICGEHGGDPDSIQFFHEVGLDYVSCSPFRVPIARVSAAQAKLRETHAASE
jgi:pyruvate,orthophosphate dikinase